MEEVKNLLLRLSKKSATFSHENDALICSLSVLKTSSYHFHYYYQHIWRKIDHFFIKFMVNLLPNKLFKIVQLIINFV